MSGGQKTAHKNPMSDKPVDEQMLLFAPFFSERHNRVFDIYDALPRFVLTWKREVSDKSPKVITFSNVRIGDQTVAEQITPAVVVDPAATPPLREGAPQRLSAKMIFPGPREEIIEFALRRMAAVQHADMKRRTGKDADQVTLTFRLSQLREQLAEDGHHFKGAEIAEAMNVLAQIRFSFPATFRMMLLMGIDGRPHRLIPCWKTFESSSQRKATRRRRAGILLRFFHPLARRDTARAFL